MAVLLASTSFNALAQNTEVKGTVRDEKGEGLPGVSIQVNGSTQGTITDVNGSFSLSAPANGSLVFSYIGFVNQTVPVNGRSVIEVTLAPDAKSLDEVVVTALGIKREKKALTYAVTEVGGEALTKAREVNLGNALAGRVAGVTASNTATGPNGSSRVIIRGNGSLSGDNQPLYVVNGVPINNTTQGSAGTFGGIDRGDGLSSINPDDIESISVLKGGTAAALYGSRAANGVILITTKSGRAQKGLGVEFNSTSTFERPLTYPDWQYEYGSGSRGAKPTIQSEAIANGRMSWGAKLDGSPVIQPDGVARPYVAQKDNIKNFYQTGTTFSNTLALTGGNETANFRFSASDLNNKGIVENSSMNRKTFNLNANANLGKKIIFEGNAQYNIEVNKNRSNIADFTMNPNASVGVLATSIDVRTLAPGYDERGYETPWNDYNFVVNPYFAINKVRNQDERRRFIGTFSTRYNITDFLYARARIGIDYFNIEGFNITPTGILYNAQGQMSTNQNTTYENNAEVLVGFEKTLGKFSVNALAGGNRMHNQVSGTDLSSGLLNAPFQYFIGNGSSQTFATTFRESAINSLFASADVSFNNVLFLTLTGRQDWFSTLSVNNNSLFYPSAGLSFVFSDAWNSKPAWLDYAKVRTSWAQVGGGAPNPYGLDLSYTAQSVTHLGQQLMGITGNTIPNSLKPYTSTTAEAGLEMKVFQNRLGVDVAVYDRTTTNDIVNATVPISSSYNSVSLNVGKMRNRGIELLLTGTPVKSAKGFSWDVSYNMAYNQNTVIKIAEGLTSLALPGARPRTENAYIYHYEGQPFGMIAGFQMKRDANGNIVYNKANGLPMQSAITPLGRGVPPLTTGLTNNLNYKNFSFSFLLDGRFGSKLYTSTNAYGTYFGLDKRTVENNVRETGVTVNGVDQNGDQFSKVVPAQDYFQGIAYTITDQFV
ncbi:MAG: SusC/RagA family TonB-linked outer membrane protein, partial [Bacteroidota bacterium]|nr:SusC/RagA family TonB-linked outer membrane protein [Bacteroidota bacterium]